MARDIDALTSSTLKHLRERWWDDAFTTFLRDNLQPRAGNRILDVGCGVGTAEVNLGLLHLAQVDLFAVDIVSDSVREALQNTQLHNIQVGYAVADASHLPFVDRAFDSTFCVAVLQHIVNFSQAVAEMARVTKPGGRILVVEPDNGARYWHSSTETGQRIFELAVRFFTSVAEARGGATDPTVGPKLPTVMAQHRIEPLAVHLFPVYATRLGAPSPAAWLARREAVEQVVMSAPDESLKRLGVDYLKEFDRYRAEASTAGSAFTEIQYTMLFATVGQREED